MAAATIPLIWRQALDDDGEPMAGALLYSKVAGTDTDLPLYADVDLTTPLDNPVEADAGGYFPVCFMLPTGYKFILATAEDVVFKTGDMISDPGAVFAENFGDAMTEDAALSVTAGYTVTASNLFVTVASSGATTINLPAVGTRTQPVNIKNVGAGTVVVTPNGLDKIESSLSTYTIAAASTPLFPSIWLYPGVGTWWIFASHRTA